MQGTDMNIDATRIRTERERRAWSQEQLAEIAGLGLRTVQRIEAMGVASFESAAALSSALSIPVGELRLANRSDKNGAFSAFFKARPAVHLCVLVVTLVVALILSPPMPTVFTALLLSLWVAYAVGVAVALRRPSF